MSVITDLNSIEGFLDHFDHCQACGRQLYFCDVLPLQCLVCLEAGPVDWEIGSPIHAHYTIARQALKHLIRVA